MRRRRNTGSWIAIGAIAVVLVTLVVGWLARDDDDVRVTPPATTVAADVDRTLSALEQQVFDEVAVPPIGLTDEERRCLTIVLAAGVDNTQDALDKTAPFDSPGEAFRSLAPGCVSAPRAVALDAAWCDYVDDELDRLAVTSGQDSADRVREQLKVDEVCG